MHEKRGDAPWFGFGGRHSEWPRSKAAATGKGSLEDRGTGETAGCSGEPDRSSPMVVSMGCGTVNRA